MVIDFSQIGVVKEQPVLVLCNSDGTAIQTLGYAYELEADICYNEMSTITFEIPAYVDGVKTPHYDDITGMRIIDMIGWGRFILMNPSIKNDGAKEIKSCKAYSLEYELTYKQTYFEESTYNFWNPLSPGDTVLGMIMEDLPSWTVGTVDEDLIGRYRTFSASDSNTYNFIKSTLQKTYNCIFDFDTYTRTINVRSTANESVTEPIYLSMDNLVKEIKIEEDTESIVTVLDVNGGEDVDIRMVNPLGTNKIYNLDYFMNTSHFDQSLIDKWTAWKNSFESNQLAYYNISVERTLKTSAILTEKAALADLKNVKLASLQSERSVYVEYLAQLTKKSDDYYDYQDKLDDVNDRIADVNDEIADQDNIVAQLEREEAELTNRLLAIQNSIAFSKYFTAEELIILDRYFKEDSIEESTFVVSEVNSYSESDISNSISNAKVSFANCSISKVITENSKTMYSISNGTISIISANTSLTADIVSACIERDTDDSIVLSAYLNKGTVGETSFPSGCISITGTASLFTTSGSSGLNCTVVTGNMYFTRNTTDYEKHSVSWELYEYGKGTLDSLAYPSYTFDVSSANFMSLEEFVSFVNHLRLGQKIYLNTDSSVLQPIFIGLKIKFEDLSSLSLEFGDKYSSSDNSFKIVELLDQSISMGKSVDANKLNYSSFVNSGASTKVKEFMDSALDVAKNAILSSSGQGVAWDETGLHLRKYIDPNNQDSGFEDEQIWMINNSIVFTDDGWQTAKMAIGKIIDENIARYPETSDTVFNKNKTYYCLDKNGDYIVWQGTEDDWGDRPLLYEKDATAYGIVAPYIVGTILAGQNLIITTEDGSFRVDSSGVHIDSMKLFITQDGSSYDTTLGDELSKLTKSEKETAKKLSDAIDRINDIDEKVENTVTTHYQDSVPTNAQEGDLWYVTGDCVGDNESDVYLQGKLFRYNGTGWDEITDADAIAAIEKANEAQATADGKITSYYQNYVPANPDYGDLWYNTATSKTLTRCIEVGDDLSQVTLYFDKSKFPTTYSCSENELVIETLDSQYNAGIYVRTVANTLVIRQGSTYYHVYNYSSGKLQRESITLSSFFGKVTAVDKNSPFYSGITATFTSSYTPQKLYRYDGSKWLLVEDGDIETVKTNVSNITKTLSEYITEEGYLTANKLKGAISTSLSTMQNGTGNVLFDNKGIWLMNAATKETSTSAIWMNENGILFGTGTRGYIDADEDDNNAWKWTTAIGHDGVIADAIATKTLSAFTIKGGSINIGNGNFVVNTKGELTAKEGVFKGIVQASDFKDASGNSMMNGSKFNSDYLSLYGIKIKNKSTNTVTFAVDENGAVTINGGVTLSTGSKIVWAKIDESDSSAYKKALQAIDDADDAYNHADDAYDYAESAYSRANSARTLAQNIANGKYSGGTFINGTSIYSPEIYAKDFNVIPTDNNSSGSFNLYAYYESSLLHCFKLGYFGGIAPYVTFSSPCSAYAQWRFTNTDFYGNISFSNATVTGLTTTAKFG